MISFLLAAALGFSAQATDLEYRDEDFGCTEQATAERYVKDYKIKIKTFGGIELCNGASDSKKLFNDLSIIENGRFDETSSNGLIRGNVAATQYYAWMKSQTYSIDRRNDVPYATAYNRMGRFTMQDSWAKLSTLGRVGTVIHEARHTGGYGHIECTQGPYRDSNVRGCDPSYSYGGSHAVEIEYYARVSVQGTNFHPVYKTMARLMAMARGNFTFNQPVLQKREALLAIQKDTGVPVLFDRGTRVRRDRPAVTGGWLKRTSFGAVIFDGLHAMAIEMYKPLGQGTQIPDSYSYFKLVQQSSEPMKDLEEYDIANKRYVVGVNTLNGISSFNFARGAWNGWQDAGIHIARTSSRLESGEQGFFLISDEGAIHPFDSERGRMGAALAERWNPEIQEVAIDENKQPVILTVDGKLQSRSENGQWTDWLLGQDSLWSDIVNVPLYDSFEVVK